jgi:hypothetical protein
MINTFVLSIVRLVQRLAILLTLGCLAYVIFFFCFKNQDSFIAEGGSALQGKGITLASSLPVFNLKPYEASPNSQARDIFSLASEVPSTSVPNTPKGQLPDHLKVVGILISHPSQVVIEDTLSHASYFIDEGHPQQGIKIVKVSKDQVVINYQGQDIVLPAIKN